MFTGLTASQYAIRNRDRKDNEPPVIAPGAECEHWECQQAITHKQATVAMPVYGVGCKIEEYRLACDEHAGTDDEESFFCDDCEHEHRQRTSWEPH